MILKALSILFVISINCFARVEHAGENTIAAVNRPVISGVEKKLEPSFKEKANAAESFDALKALLVEKKGFWVRGDYYYLTQNDNWATIDGSNCRPKEEAADQTICNFGPQLGWLDVTAKKDTIDLDEPTLKAFTPNPENVELGPQETQMQYYSNMYRFLMGNIMGFDPVLGKKFPNGLRALTPCETLVKGSRNWSGVMARSNGMVHASDIGHRDADNTWAENISMGQVDVREAVRTWFHSTGHRTNLLNENFVHIGVSGKISDRLGSYYTQRFSGWKAPVIRQANYNNNNNNNYRRRGR